MPPYVDTRTSAVGVTDAARGQQEERHGWTERRREVVESLPGEADCFGATKVGRNEVRARALAHEDQLVVGDTLAVA